MLRVTPLVVSFLSSCVRDSPSPERLFPGRREVGRGKVSCEGGAGETCGLEQSTILACTAAGDREEYRTVARMEAVENSTHQWVVRC